MKTGVHGRSRVRSRGRPGTDEGRENVTLLKQMAAMAEAMSKDGRSEMWMTMTTAAKTRTCTCRSVSQPRRRVPRDRRQSQAGGAMCPGRTLNQKPVHHPRAAVLKYIRNARRRVQGHGNISSPHYPREEPARARLRP